MDKHSGGEGSSHGFWLPLFSHQLKLVANRKCRLKSAERRLLGQEPFQLLSRLQPAPWFATSFSWWGEVGFPPALASGGSWFATSFSWWEGGSTMATRPVTSP